MNESNKMGSVCTEPIESDKLKSLFHEECVLSCTKSPCALIPQTSMRQESRLRPLKRLETLTLIFPSDGDHGKMCKWDAKLLIFFWKYLSAPTVLMLSETKWTVQN